MDTIVALSNWADYESEQCGETLYRRALLDRAGVQENYTYLGFGEQSGKTGCMLQRSWRVDLLYQY